MLTTLLPFAEVVTSHPISTLIVAFDAFLIAMAVTFRYVIPNMAMQLYHKVQKEIHSQNYLRNDPTSAVLEVVSKYRWRKAFVHK